MPLPHTPGAPVLPAPLESPVLPPVSALESPVLPSSPVVASVSVPTVVVADVVVALPLCVIAPVADTEPLLVPLLVPPLLSPVSLSAAASGSEQAPS
jgi:hypothetical protein